MNDDPLPDPEQADDVARVLDAIHLLPERERIVLTRRLEGETLAQIGQDLKVNRERVRQIEEKARIHLRKLVTG